MIADSGGGVDAAIPDGVLRTSRVWAYSYAFGGIEAGGAGAQFFDQDPSPVAITRDEVDGCDVVTTTLLVEPGMGAFPTYRDAGDIEIAGGVAPIQIVQADSPFYESVTSDARLWDPGATLTISATGGADVAAFSATAIAPGNVEVTSPTLPLGGAPPVIVDRSMDLSVTWIAGAPGDEIAIRVVGPEVDTEPNVTIECRFDPAAGSGTIPSGALSRIERTGMGVLTVDTVSDQTVAAGAWGSVAVELSASGVWSTGNNYLATIEVR